MPKHTDLMRVLRETSRTFFIPISRLPPGLLEAVAGAYACMRAIDEIEDHASLNSQEKVKILTGLAACIETGAGKPETKRTRLSLKNLLFPYHTILPEVSLRLGDWLVCPPEAVTPRIWEAVITMADRMAYWASREWQIKTAADLDGYTFSVAGVTGSLICDLWAWFDGSTIDRAGAIHFGRALQAVNILRNRAEDLQRGVDFYPAGWTDRRMMAYAESHLEQVRKEFVFMPGDSYHYIVEIPLKLAEATLIVIKSGVAKLTRQQVQQIIQEIPARIASPNPTKTDGSVGG